MKYIALLQGKWKSHTEVEIETVSLSVPTIKKVAND
jgi:hypothetical protein